MGDLIAWYVVMLEWFQLKTNWIWWQGDAKQACCLYLPSVMSQIWKLDPIFCTKMAIFGWCHYVTHEWSETFCAHFSGNLSFSVMDSIVTFQNCPMNWKLSSILWFFASLSIHPYHLAAGSQSSHRWDIAHGGNKQYDYNDDLWIAGSPRPTD